MSTEQRLATAKGRIKKQRDALLAKGIDPDAPKVPNAAPSFTKYKASRVQLSEEQISEYEYSLGTVTYDELLAHVVEVRNRPGEMSRHIPAINPYSEAHKQSLRDEYSVKLAQAMLFVLWRFNQEGSLSKACEHEWLSYGAVKAWRKTFPMFDEVLAELEEELIQAADDELYDRAIRGVDKPVISQGALVFVKTKSDDLLKFYLQNNRKKYATKQITEVTGAGGGPIKSVGLDVSSLRGLSNEELDALEKMMEKAAG
jgi:hypothetical protein